MNIKEIIRGRVRIYTKEKFFELFSKILIEKSTHFFKPKKEKLFKEKNISNYEPDTLWNYLTIIIIKKCGKPKIQYPDLTFNYMVLLCNKIFKQLISIAIRNKLNLRNLTEYYIDLCKKDIENLKESKTKKVLKIKKPQSPLSNVLKTRIKTKNPSFLNSYTNLFIGDVEEESVFQRYLSNILVLSSQKVYAHGSYVDFSKNYVKNYYSKINNLSDLNKPKDSRNLSIVSGKVMTKKTKLCVNRKIYSYKDSKPFSHINLYKKVRGNIIKCSSMQNLFSNNYIKNMSFSTFNRNSCFFQQPKKKLTKKKEIIKYFLSKSDFYYDKM